MAEAGALGGPLDQPRDVGEHRLAVLALDRAQLRRERRERVVGDLRLRPRQPAQQRGLARVRQPDQADVGQQLQPQLDPARLALVPFSANRGAWRVEVAKRLFPCPPRPPWATTARWPASTSSTGCRRRPRPACPAAPRSPGPPPARRARFDPSPCRPRPARKCLLPASDARSRREESQTSTTSPPCPPSPPSGPPRGTCASRRKLPPSPPRPPSTQIFALSYIGRGGVVGEGRVPRPRLAGFAGSAARGRGTRPSPPKRPATTKRRALSASGPGVVVLGSGRSGGVGHPSERLVTFRRLPAA